MENARRGRTNSDSSPSKSSSRTNHPKMENGSMDSSSSSKMDFSPVRKSHRTLSAVLRNGTLVTVDVIVDGCQVVGPKDALTPSTHEGSRRKSSMARTDSTTSESHESAIANGHPDKRRSTRNRNESSMSESNQPTTGEPSSSHKNPKGQSKDGIVQNVMGDDGNWYYCAICHDVGDVVCCDHCPKVYHPTCIPEGCESRISMDADEDPWFCPECMSGGQTRTTSGNKKGRANREATSDGSKSSDDAELSPLQGAATNFGAPKGRSVRERANASTPPQLKRKLNHPSSGEKNPKKRKTSESVDVENGNVEEITDECDGEYSPYESQLVRNEAGIIKAVSPFFYFLLDNRIRLERQLGRKNRLFKRAVKGYDRNVLIAKEGLVWWETRATGQEKKRYMDLSMKEFEENVILWKEEETIKEMYQLADEPVFEIQHETTFSDINPDDEKYWKGKTRGLASCSKIECNRSKSQQNTILMELLQDTRFHPLPMMTPNRELSTAENPDYSEMVVPHFNVQGPIATCVGDQCIGCTRGWNHFCPIMGRQFPAVEHRAKLQPPYPSFMATRIGAGLVLDKMEDSKVQVDGAKRYKDVATMPLTEPSARGDDVMNFVDKLVAVKMPAAESKSESPAKLSRGILPTKWKVNGDDAKESTFVCGKCKSTINTSQGCISCRRAQLLVDAAKQEANDGHDSSIRMHTSMLARANIKMDDFEHQTKSDKALARALAAKPWKPNTILPPMAKFFPPSNLPPSSHAGSSDEESLVSDSDAEERSESSKDEPLMNRAKSPMLPSQDEDEETPVESANKHIRRLPRRGSCAADDGRSDANRQAREVAYKEESVELQSRCLSIAACGILLGLIRRDPLRLFAEAVPINVESYYKIIKNPIDFSKIKAKVLNGEYNTLGAFASDVKLLCTNGLIYNPPGTIYSTTANELRDAFDLMQKRASDWILAIKNAHASYYSRRGRTGQQQNGNGNGKRSYPDDDEIHQDDDPFYELRKSWPGAIDLLEENGEWMRSQLSAEFVRTKENENAYYGALAIRRAAAAAAASLAPIYDSERIFQPCIRRNHIDDEKLRNRIDREVAKASDLSELQHYPNWREGDVLGLMKKVQKWRVDKKTSPDELCVRCVSSQIHGEAKLARYAESNRKRRRLEEVQVRVADSRGAQSTGMASKKERDRIAALDTKTQTRGQSSVTVRGSHIQGWGLYADHSFKKGEVVAEYVGEYVVNPVTDLREKIYAEGRIQDYQFRVSANTVIDATKHGGFARYINHSCDPNCMAKIIDGDAPNQHLKRVVVSSQRSIEAGEEITYDYQFPIELDLDARLPCSCGAKTCRGFMNWDLPESTSLISRARTSRGRKERIRNLVRKEMK